MPIKLESKSIYYQVEERKLFMEQFHLPYLQVTFHLLAYDWPGNVRELENLIERALILSRMADG